MVYYKRSFRRRRFPIRRRKRWSLSGHIKTPFGYSAGLSFNSKRGLQKRAMYGIAKKVVRNTVLPKTKEQAQFNVFVGGPQPKSGTIYTHNFLKYITQGTSDDDRVGDEIYVKNIAMNLKLSQTTTNANEKWHSMFWRVMVVSTPKEHNTTNFDSGIGTSDIFHDFTDGNQIVAISVDKDLSCKVLFDKTYKLQTNSTITSMSKNCKINVNVNKPFRYKEGTVFGKYNNYYLLLIPLNENIATGIILNDSSCDLAYHINFSDSK